ncbi:unnamed protein product, partial [Tenebrio molitor]
CPRLITLFGFQGTDGRCRAFPNQDLFLFRRERPRLRRCRPPDSRLIVNYVGTGFLGWLHENGSRARRKTSCNYNRIKMRLPSWKLLREQ